MKNGSTAAADGAYRGDMDGLRAIAVLSVILFHLDVSGISGGFVGVDIFFVISGYLITHIIRQQVSLGSFSFAHFYERRVRRLVPALYTMLLFAGVAASLLVSPTDLVAFANAVAASLLWVPNLHFLQQAGYFADASTRPLLHMWSLGVEAQFYLLWPVLLLFILRRHARHAWKIVAAIGLLSLIGASVLIATYPETTFYLVFSRLFEFFIGAGIAWVPAPNITPKSKALLNVGLLAGLVMIAISVTCYDKHTPIPSLYALLPCVGAGLILYTGRYAGLGLVLSNRVMAYLGRISYELYLFHWPALIFYKYAMAGPLQLADRAIIFGITLVLSVITYHGVSYPLRHGYSKLPTQRQNYLIGCLLVAAVLLAVSLSMKASNGWQWRLSEEARLFTRDAGKFHSTQFGGVGYKEDTLITLGDTTKPPQFILIGDSFAGQYAAGLSEFLKQHQRSAYLYHRNGCLIMPHVFAHVTGQGYRECQEVFGRIMQIIQTSKLPVIQAQSWSSFKEQTVRRDGTPVQFTKENNNDYYQFMMDAIGQMHQALGDRPYLFVGISPGVQNQQSLMRCFQVPRVLHSQCASSVALKEETQLNGQEFNLAAAALVKAQPSIQFINPRAALCRDGVCHAISDSKIYYSDYSHFTKDGALEVIRYYQDLLLSLKPAP